MNIYPMFRQGHQREDWIYDAENTDSYISE